MEAEIQRRKEHLNEATNFEEARGFVRSNWKTKNWNPNEDPTQHDSSTDSEDEAVVLQEEKRDIVRGSPSRSPRILSDSEERDNFNGSVSNEMSLSLANQLSAQKSRKRRVQQKPIVIDVHENQMEKDSLPTVKEQLDTLNAIKEYNKKLKPARKVKDALPEIITCNISTKQRYVKDYKK